MLDPVGSFRRIRDFVVSYIEKSLRTADPATEAARRRLLLTQEALVTDPLSGPVLGGESPPRSLEQLLRDEEILGPVSQDGRVALVELVLSGLFDGAEAAAVILRRKSRCEQLSGHGSHSGYIGIATCARGTGQAASFMLPVLAQISNEAVRWPAPRPNYLQSRWWRDASRYVAGRALEAPQRPAAMRAIILCPMNALLEDHMVRLRKALDSDMARDVMNVRFGGNRIFFGQYTCATPVSGYLRHPRRFADRDEQNRQRQHMQKLRESMREMEATQDAARRQDQEARRIAQERARRPQSRRDSSSRRSTAAKWCRDGTCRWLLQISS
jgi:hypothetical protein